MNKEQKSTYTDKGKRKQLKDLTIKDNFLFGTVMADEENCRLLLEMILGFRIKKVTVRTEKSISYHPEYKGVRLDICAEDEENARYNVEMQAINKDNLRKRSRYYHSQMDMELLLSGLDYERLSDSYVIFICDFDPFGKKLYKYTFGNQCREDADLKLEDGSTTIYLSTKGKNTEDVPANLVTFLKYVGADLQESQKDFQDEFVKRLQESVKRIKSTREMERKYMLLELLLRDERREGKAEGKAEGIAEGILDILSEYGEIPDSLRTFLLRETNLEKLRSWLKQSVRVQSVEEFSQMIIESSDDIDK